MKYKGLKYKLNIKENKAVTTIDLTIASIFILIFTSTIARNYV